VPKKFAEKRPCLFVTGLLFLFLTGITPAVAEEEPAERCLDCHEKTWAEGEVKRFLHQPFREKQCRVCHVDSPSGSENQPRNQGNSPERSRVKWVDRNFSPGQMHWFKFSVPEGNETLFLEVNANRGKTRQYKVPLPPLDDLPRYDNDHTPPLISNVRVLEVKKDLSLSAVIGWETDEDANSVVEYGIEKFNMSSPLENSFTTHHQVTLTGIKAQKIYQFKVVSEDLFGNSAASEVFTLATDKFFSVPDEPPPLGKTDFKLIEVNPEIFQSDGRYLVRVTASQPVKMALGFLPAAFKKSDYRKDGDSPQEVRHVLTNDEFRTSISICYGCHRQYQEGMSHPVNVYPKRGIVIPPEYPTLPDGRMTCMSCHTRHASNLKYRLIKASNRELCVGCHGEMK
jgi:predicted CXXCH cytochrome family protein